MYLLIKLLAWNNRRREVCIVEKTLPVFIQEPGNSLKSQIAIANYQKGIIEFKGNFIGISIYREPPEIIERYMR